MENPSCFGDKRLRTLPLLFLRYVNILQKRRNVLRTWREIRDPHRDNSPQVVSSIIIHNGPLCISVILPLGITK